MRVRSVPSILRTLAIFVASLQAGGGGFGSLADAHDLAKAPAQPVLQSGAARTTSNLSAEELAGQALLLAPATLSAPGQDGSNVSTLDAAPAVAPSRPPSTRTPRSVSADRGDLSYNADGVTCRGAVTRSRASFHSSLSKSPARIRAP